jgi:tripartite-type tricarboxylate transporter receptor subunit TctC
MSKISRLISIAVVSLLVLTDASEAEHYPDRVVRIVNPYPPGGSVDVMARILAQKLSDNLGQQFIVENRSGGGGNTGSDYVAKAEPDGYTLLFTAPGTAHRQPDALQQAHVRPGQGLRSHRAVRDRAHRVDRNPAVPANDVQELIALAKKEPGKINFAFAATAPPITSPASCSRAGPTSTSCTCPIAARDRR